MSAITIRLATSSDANSIAALHAISWINTYRGILPDIFLDNDLQNEREKYWADKMSKLSANDFVLIAENEKSAVGFIAVLDKPEKGYEAFIDNLHVRTDLKGMGIGGRLMRVAAEKLMENGKKSAYLWVLKGNDSAAAFYRSKGAETEDVTMVNFGGKAVAQTRFVWRNVERLK